MEIELYLYNVLVRWGHILVGIAWIGLLYYFNFVQTEYVKVADPDAKADVMKKLAPNALWWFRWAAFLTFLTGLYLLYVQERAITTPLMLLTTNVARASPSTSSAIIRRDFPALATASNSGNSSLILEIFLS